MLVFQVVNNHTASTRFEVFDAAVVALPLCVALRIVILVLRIGIRYMPLVLSKAMMNTIRKRGRDWNYSGV
jgi:hypothetical protein